MNAVVKDISTQAETNGAFPVTLTLNDVQGGAENGKRSEPNLRVGMTAETTFELPRARANDDGTDVASLDSSELAAAADKPDDRSAAPLSSIPVAAYLPALTDGEGFVFVFEKATGTIAKRTVRLQTITGDRALIRASKADLPAQAIIASRGVAFLKNGQAVALKGAGTARYNP